jgi:chromosome segregation ATPase
MRTPHLPLLALGAVLFLARAAPAAAQTDNRLREALRTATTQLRTLEDEKAQWQARETELKAEVEKLKKNGAAAGARSKDDRQLRELQRRLDEQKEGATKAAEALAKCEANARDGASAAATGEAERTRLAAELKEATARLEAAEARNGRMYRAAADVLDWIDRIGWVSALANREPLLGLKRVELENAAQDHRDKLLDARSRAGGTP